MKFLKLSFWIFFIPCLMGTHSCAKNEPRIVQGAHTHSEHDAHIHCNSDADCTAIKSDCCGCNQGGKQRVVAKSQAQFELNKLIVNCQDVACMQIISQDPSCQQKASCKSGHCALE